MACVCLITRWIRKTMGRTKWAQISWGNTGKPWPSVWAKLSLCCVLGQSCLWRRCEGLGFVWVCCQTVRKLSTATSKLFVHPKVPQLANQAAERQVMINRAHTPLRLPGRSQTRATPSIPDKAAPFSGLVVHAHR